MITVLYVDGAPAYYMTPIKDVEGEGESSAINMENPNRKVASKMGQRGSLR